MAPAKAELDFPRYKDMPNGPWETLFMRKTLRKHAYSNILKNLPPKNQIFQRKNSDIFLIFAQNIDCGYASEPPRRGGSNEYQQSMRLSRNKKNNVCPCKPHFYFIKVGFRGGAGGGGDKII